MYAEEKKRSHLAQTIASNASAKIYVETEDSFKKKHFS